jgi:hypothetical protein
MKQDSFFGHYQQNHLWLREKSVLGAKCPKIYSVIVWEYGGRNRKAAKPRCFKNLKLNISPVKFEKQ